jgi:hypothetical protein
MIEQKSIILIIYHILLIVMLEDLYYTIENNYTTYVIFHLIKINFFNFFNKMN